MGTWLGGGALQELGHGWDFREVLLGQHVLLLHAAYEHHPVCLQREISESTLTLMHGMSD